MKIIVTAIALCFVASVADARCASRDMASDDPLYLAQYDNFTFACHDGISGATNAVNAQGQAELNPDIDVIFSQGVGTAYGMVHVLSIQRQTECGLLYEDHLISIGEDPPSPSEMLQGNRMSFTTLGMALPRDPDDKCNNREAVIGFYRGFYELEETRGPVVPNPWRVFNSLIVMHLYHMHGERVNPNVPEVFINWKEDGDLTAPEIREMKKRGEYR